MSTTVQLSLAEAAAYANRYIAWRDEYLFKLRYAMAREAMRRTVWQRLFGLPARTLEQAHRYLSSGSTLSDYNLLRLRGSLFAKAARNILAVAANTPNLTAVVSVDVNVLAEWVKR